MSSKKETRLFSGSEIPKIALVQSKFKAVPLSDMGRAMANVRKLMKKNVKTLEILKH